MTDQPLPIPSSNPFPDLYPAQYRVFKKAQRNLKSLFPGLNSTTELLYIACIFFCTTFLIIISSVSVNQMSSILNEPIPLIGSMSYLFLFVFAVPMTIAPLYILFLVKYRQKSNEKVLTELFNTLVYSQIEDVIVSLRDLDKQYGIAIKVPRLLALNWIESSGPFQLYRCFEYLFSDLHTLQCVDKHSPFNNHQTFAGYAKETLEEEMEKQKQKEYEQRLMMMGNTAS